MHLLDLQLAGMSLVGAHPGFCFPNQIFPYFSISLIILEEVEEGMVMEVEGGLALIISLNTNCVVKLTMWSQLAGNTMMSVFNLSSKDLTSNQVNFPIDHLHLLSHHPHNHKAFIAFGNQFSHASQPVSHSHSSLVAPPCMALVHHDFLPLDLVAFAQLGAYPPLFRGVWDIFRATLVSRLWSHKSCDSWSCKFGCFSSMHRQQFMFPPIVDVGSSLFHANSLDKQCFHLHNILHVPDIPNNLLLKIILHISSFITLILVWTKSHTGSFSRATSLIDSMPLISVFTRLKVLLFLCKPMLLSY